MERTQSGPWCGQTRSGRRGAARLADVGDDAQLRHLAQGLQHHAALQALAVHGVQLLGAHLPKGGGRTGDQAVGRKMGRAMGRKKGRAMGRKKGQSEAA